MLHRRFDEGFRRRRGRQKGKGKCKRVDSLSRQQNAVAGQPWVAPGGSGFVKYHFSVLVFLAMQSHRSPVLVLIHQHVFYATQYHELELINAL